MTIVAACEKNSTATIPSAEEEIFEKTITIVDDAANEVDLQIRSLHADLVAELSAEDFVLITTSESFSDERDGLEIASDYAPANAMENDANLAAYVGESPVVDLTTHPRHLNGNVTGFAVRPKGSRDVNAVVGRLNYNFYTYGSTGARGAQVDYENEPRSRCNLDIDLYKGDRGAIFWNKIASGKLKNAGNSWRWSSTVAYYEYRLKIGVGTKRVCKRGSEDDFSFFWIRF